jgi:hypothetical protein
MRRRSPPFAGGRVGGELRTPLSSVQKIAVLQAALLEFDGFEAQLRSLDEMDTLLRELDRRR